MSKTEFTEYSFTVKESAPSTSDEEAEIFLMCEPLTKELSILGNGGFISIKLKPRTSIQDANEIKNYIKQHISGISVTTF